MHAGGTGIVHEVQEEIVDWEDDHFGNEHKLQKQRILNTAHHAAYVISLLFK